MENRILETFLSNFTAVERFTKEDLIEKAEKAEHQHET